MEVNVHVYNPTTQYGGEVTQHTVNRRLGGVQSRCEHFGEETSEAPAGNQCLHEIETRFFGSPACSVVATSAALSRLPSTNTDNQINKPFVSFE